MTHRQQTSLLFTTALVCFGPFLTAGVLWPGSTLLALGAVLSVPVLAMVWAVCDGLVTRWRRL